MKTTLYTLVGLFGFFAAHAQDIILLKDGTQIKSKIIKIGTSEIKDKVFDNISGLAYASERRTTMSYLTYRKA